MANVTLLGASYTDVPAVTLPQTGGGTVTFYENGGGGGDGYFKLLEEITVTEDVRAVYLDFSDYQSYNDLIVLEDVTLSSADWVYYSLDTSTPTGGVYDYQTISKKGICFLWSQDVSGENIVGITLPAPSTRKSNGRSANLCIYTYVASNAILAGSKFWIYGGKHEDL